MGLAGQMLYSLIAVAVNLLLVGGALARWIHILLNRILFHPNWETSIHPICPLIAPQFYIRF